MDEKNKIKYSASGEAERHFPVVEPLQPRRVRLRTYEKGGKKKKKKNKSRAAKRDGRVVTAAAADDV